MSGQKASTFHLTVLLLLIWLFLTRLLMADPQALPDLMGYVSPPSVFWVCPRVSPELYIHREASGGFTNDKPEPQEHLHTDWATLNDVNLTEPLSAVKYESTGTSWFTEFSTNRKRLSTCFTTCHPAPLNPLISLCHHSRKWGDDKLSLYTSCLQPLTAHCFFFRVLYCKSNSESMSILSKSPCSISLPHGRRKMIESITVSVKALMRAFVWICLFCLSVTNNKYFNSSLTFSH